MAFDLELPDGTVLHNIPDGTTRAQIESKLQTNGIGKQEGQDLGSVNAALSGFNSAVPFGNRIVAGIGAAAASPFMDKPIGDIYDEMRRTQETTNRAHPTANMVGTGAGLLTTLPVGIETAGTKSLAAEGGMRGAINAIPELSTKIGNFVRGGKIAKDATMSERLANFLLQSGKSAAVAAPVGAVYGAGDAQEGQQLQGAEQGAGMAAALGGATPLAGVALGGAAKGLDAAKDAISSAIEPLTDSGRRQIIARLLTENSNNPEMVMKNLSNIQEYVPGSPVTTGEASGDTGLSALQRGLRNKGGNPFADIESQQNAARNSALENIAGSPSDLAKALSQRSEATGPLYQAASQESIQGRDFSGILSKIDDAVKNVGTETQAGKELLRIKDQIQNSQGDATQGGMSQLYKELRDQAAKKAGMEGAYSSAVKGVIQPIVHEFGQTLESQSPNLQQANSVFRDLSKPINQMQSLQDIQNRISMNAAPDIQSGYSFLSQPKLTGILKNEAGDLSKTLTPKQMGKLKNIESDMVRSSSLNQRNIRPTGSDTTATTNATKMLSDMLANKALSKIPLGIGNAIQSVSQSKIDELLIQSLKDPETAKQIISALKLSRPKMNLPADPTFLMRQRLASALSKD